MPYPVIPLEDRLLAKIKYVGDCWLFTGKPADKYGSLKEGGNTRTQIGAHVAAYKLWVGEIPPGLQVCHHCDTPRCCNPSHLFLGTAKQNAEDRDRKGRHWAPSGRDHYNYKHGKYAVVQPN